MMAGFDGELVAEVTTQEKTIFAARASELDRQAKSLDELRGLLKSEIEVLEEKNKTADGLIATAERELAAVSTLVDRGIAVASRKSELERKLARYPNRSARPGHCYYASASSHHRSNTQSRRPL